MFFRFLCILTSLRIHISSAFIVQRGFAALDMSSDELKCNDIVYNSSDFYALQSVHVFLTINHGGQTNGLVHDVSIKTFFYRNLII